MTRTPTAAVLIIGNEVLSGRTQDVNLNAIALKLQPLGVRIAEARVVADTESEIVAALNALRARYDHVFTTGGIGPTHDDITAASVAVAFGVKLAVHPEARARLERHYGAELTDARLRMARLPEGAEIIENPVSAAPGFRIGNVFVLAGVPNIMRAMLDHCVAFVTGGPPLLSRTVTCFVAESAIAPELAAIAAAHPETEIGSYPWFKAGRYGLALVARDTDAARLAAAADAVLAMARKHDPGAQG